MKEKNINQYQNVKLNILNSKFQTLTSDHKGITLIALVVTIIVLLILAGVTINTVFSDNGIVKRAIEAGDQAEISAYKDQIEMVRLNWQLDRAMNDSITVQTLINRLESAGLAEEVVESGEGIYDITTKEGYQFVLELDAQGNGTIEYVGKNGELLPRITVIDDSTTENSINLEIRASYLYEGKISYYLYKVGIDEAIDKKEETTETKIEFTGLELGQEYRIEIKAKNENGETSKEVGPVVILPTGTITEEPGYPIWVGDGTAKLKLATTATIGELQYQVTKGSGQIKTAWTAYSEEITGLEHGDIVEGRIKYGEIATEGDYIYNVEDDENPNAAEGVNNIGEERVAPNEEIAVTISQSDDQSGIDLSKCRWVYNTTSTMIGVDSTVWNTAKSFSEGNGIKLVATSEGTYYLHVLSVDRAGNKTETMMNKGINVSEGLKADGTFDERTGVNSPQLVKGMTAIYWDGDSWEEPDTEEEWYNYDEKRWANAKSTDGSFWVWIPRYGYQITSNWHTTSTTGGNINVVFLKNKTNEPAKEDDADMTWANASGLNNWNVHPAFTGTPSIGGWSADSYGIWVAKFEPSLAGSTSTTEADGRYNNSDKTFQIKPGVTSWRNISVNNIFTVCQNYNLIDNSHMMKNSEWGAVAYLAQSSYGKNAEVAVNQCSAYITGGGPGTGDNGVYASSTYTYSSSTFNTTYAYTTTQGKKASTTGNEYGIYDMSGGSWEYTASYVNNGHDYITNASYGGVIGESSTDAWLRQVYSSASSNGTSNQQTDYNRNSGVYGDAVYETSNGYNSSSGSWYQDYSYFPYSGTPFFLRGGNYSYTTGAGLFSFSSSNGNADADSGFRPVGLAL